MSNAELMKAKGNPHADPSEPAPRVRYQLLADLASRHLPEGGAALEIGCGAGETLHILKAARPDARIYAADAYQSCLDAAGTGITLAGSYLIGEQSFDLSPITEKFDAVIFSHTLEHLWNPTKGMLDVMRLLKPGGVVIVAVPNLARPDALVKAALRKHYVNRGHVTGWDRSHFKNFLEEILKLKVLSWHSDGVPVFPRRVTNKFPALTGLETALGRLVPFWSFSSIAIVAVPETGLLALPG
jgi:2-polyprenyl-3-methyl-5-hydroxy-6-metoxy-1,4-benzoquinol methylase